MLSIALDFHDTKLKKYIVVVVKLKKNRSNHTVVVFIFYLAQIIPIYLQLKLRKLGMPILQEQAKQNKYANID